MQIANVQGQKIYCIDQSNLDAALSDIRLSSAIIGEIRSAVNAGKYVIAHTDNVSVPGWMGAGYIIIDPLTGDGAFMISGGMNGGYAYVTTLFMMAIGALFAILQKIAQASHYLLRMFGSTLRAIGDLFMAFELRAYSGCKFYAIMVSQLLYKFFLSTTIAYALALIPGLGLLVAGMALAYFLGVVLIDSIETLKEKCNKVALFNMRKRILTIMG
jgi:hypothetical protein